MGLLVYLAAVAIPAYQNYQANAKVGVVESILRTAQRTWKVEESLGRTISSLSGSLIYGAKVESRDKGSFDDAATDFFSKETGTSPNTKWCLKITGKSTGEYNTDFGGCVNEGWKLNIGWARSSMLKNFTNIYL